jgi:hypothetical protein
MRAPVNRAVRVHDHTFVAKFVDYLWHIDLHEIHAPDETTGSIRIIDLIAFFDGASRFIMHDRLLPDERADTCSAALSETFQISAPPCALGRDNGDEFTGEAFTSLFREHGLRQWRTTRYTPEQNGKTERFWATLEHCRQRSII